MESKKNYCGSGWERKFSNGGSVINVSINLEKVKKLNPDKYGNVKLIIGQRKAADEKTKATHWVAEDDYKKETSGQNQEQKQESKQQEQKQNVQNDESCSDGLPF